MEEKIQSDQTLDEKRSLSDQHKDIEFANTYRLEYIKHLISISTGVAIFSVTFMKDVLERNSQSISQKFILLSGWGLLLLSTFAGIFHMRYWAWYFISWDINPYKEEAKKWRNKIDIKRKRAEKLQIYGFIVGFTLLTIFTAVNLFN